MKTKVLFYCTKEKPYLSSRYIDVGEAWSKKYAYNGKIVCECEVECEKITPKVWSPVKERELLEESCLTEWQLFEYIANSKGYASNPFYALHISNLKMLDKPLELNDVYYKRYNLKVGGNGFEVITKAPQNMMWVWYNGQKYCLISIRPEWLCKILNGEKTIEVRKKILKGML